MAIAIRDGEGRDFTRVMALVRELAEFEKSGDMVKNSAEQMRDEAAYFRLLVAEEGSDIIGYAVYYIAYYTWIGKSLYLDDLYVRPEYRGRKVGSMLLRGVLKRARDAGCKRVRWQVLDWNERAIGFYRKRGAVISGEWLNCDLDEKGLDKLLA